MRVGLGTTSSTGREYRLQKEVDSRASSRAVRRREANSAGLRETIPISMKGSSTIMNSSQGEVDRFRFR